MEAMFHSAAAFNQDIGQNWLTSSVTNMSQMFYAATAFNQDISDWDTSEVLNMSSMFKNAAVFNKNIKDWDTSNVGDMSYMFYNAYAFNQPIGYWNVEGATNMSNMLDQSGISTKHYDALLISWSKQDLNSGVNFGAAGRSYSGGTPSSARSLMLSSHSWFIQGDTQNNSYPISGSFTSPGNSTSMVTLNWTLSTHPNNDVMEYYVCSGASLSDIDTVDECINATTRLVWTPTQNFVTINGLSENTAYFFNVLVKDTAGNINIYSGTTASTLIAI